MYTRDGEGIATWRAFSDAAAIVRLILTISHSASAAACNVMRHDNDDDKPPMALTGNSKRGCHINS